MNLDFSLRTTAPAKTPAKTPKKGFRKCDPRLVEAAWPVFWDPEFQREIDCYKKMQWEKFRAILGRDPELGRYAKKIAAAYLYMFACWSSANPGVPLYPLIRGATPSDPALLAELRSAPRLRTKTCKFLWKDRPDTPATLSEYGTFGQLCWREELARAEERVVERIKTFRNGNK
jgi:hypothetical protein